MPANSSTKPKQEKAVIPSQAPQKSSSIDLVFQLWNRAHLFLRFTCYNDIMKWILIALITLLFLLTAGIIAVIIFLAFPDLSPFQETTFRENLIPIGTLVAAWVALLLAIGAFLAIEENVKLRREQRERENRDREERYLNEIIDWLKGLEVRVFEPPKGTLRQEMLEDKELKDKLGLTPENWEVFTALDETLKEAGSLEYEIKEGEYSKKLASNLQYGEDLSIAITTILKQLENRRQIHLETSTGTHEPLTIDVIREKVENELPLIFELIRNDTLTLEGINLSEDGLRMVLFARNAQSLKKSIGEAIEKAIGLKSSLINS